MSDALCVTDLGIGLVMNWCILTLIALSAWLVLRTGRISLGQQAYFGIGAYAAAVTTVMNESSLLLALLIATVCGATFAALVSWSMRLLSGLQYALATLAIAELVRTGLASWNWRIQHKNGYLIGPDGINGFREIRWLYEHQISQELYLFIGLSILLAVLILILALNQTRIGLAVRTVGFDSTLASANGQPVHQLRLITQTLAGALAALAGGLYAHQTTYVEPAIFDVMLGVHAVGYAMIGGLATPLGPLIGAAFDLGLLEATRLFEGWRMVIFGGLIAAFLRWRPGGFLDDATINKLKLFIQRRKNNEHAKFA